MIVTADKQKEMEAYIKKGPMPPMAVKNLEKRNTNNESLKSNRTSAMRMQLSL